MTPPAASIDHHLGMLRGNVEALTRDYHEEKANRKELYRRIEEIANVQTVIMHKLEAYDNRMNNVEPSVSEFKAWRERLRGALWLATAAGGAIGAGITYVWDKLSN